MRTSSRCATISVSNTASPTSSAQSSCRRHARCGRARLSIVWVVARFSGLPSVFFRSCMREYIHGSYVSVSFNTSALGIAESRSVHALTWMRHGTHHLGGSCHSCTHRRHSGQRRGADRHLDTKRSAADPNLEPAQTSVCREGMHTPHGQR